MLNPILITRLIIIQEGLKPDRLLLQCLSGHMHMLIYFVNLRFCSSYSGEILSFVLYIFFFLLQSASQVIYSLFILNESMCLLFNLERQPLCFLSPDDLVELWVRVVERIPLLSNEMFHTGKATHLHHLQYSTLSWISFSNSNN